MREILFLHLKEVDMIASPKELDSENPSEYSMEGDSDELPCGSVWEVDVIVAGQSKNNRNYPVTVLEKAVPLFEGLPIAEYEFDGKNHHPLDHVPSWVQDMFPGSVTRNIVGFLKNVHMEGQVMKATAFITCDDLRSRLMMSRSQGLPDFLQLSIDAGGVMDPNGVDVAEITVANELTVVTKGAAGGRFRRMVCSDSASILVDEESYMVSSNGVMVPLDDKISALKTLKKVIEGMSKDLEVTSEEELEKNSSQVELATEQAPESESVAQDSNEDELKKGEAVNSLLEEPEAPEQSEGVANSENEMKESLIKMEDNIKQDVISIQDVAAELKPAELKPSQELLEAEKRVAEMVNRAAIAMSDHDLVLALRECGLPAAQQGLVEAQLKGKVHTAEERTALIESIRGAFEQGIVQSGLKSTTPKVEMGPGRLEKAKAYADVLAGYDYSKLSDRERDVYKYVDQNPSLRRWYESVNDDNTVSGQAGPGALLREATTASVPDLLADAFNKTLLQQYDQADVPWRQFAQIGSCIDFKTINNYIFGTLGVLASISESDTSDTVYPRLGLGGDEKIQYSVEQKGGKVVVTRKMLINDDLQALRAIPTNMADSANRSIAERVFQALLGASGGTIGGDLSYDGYAMAHANHRNTSTTAMSYSAIIASWNRLRNQCRFANVGTLAAAVADGTTTTVSLSAALWEAVKPGDTIQVEAEVMKITAIGSSPTVTVVRGIDGTTGAAHSNGLRVEQRGNPIVSNDIKLLYPYSLEETASALWNSQQTPGSANNDYNRVAAEVRSGRLTPVSLHANWLLSDLTNYYLVAGKPVKVDFLNGAVNPQFITLKGESDYSMFYGDRIEYKIRHEYAVSAPDHRYIDYNIVAG